MAYYCSRLQTHLAFIDAMERRQKLFLEKLTASRIFQDYKRAFESGTGLPLAVTSSQSWGLPHRFGEKENPFCALMAKSSKTCAACLEVQKRLSDDSEHGPVTLTCFAGLCDSAVPIRMGEDLIGLLQTGQVFVNAPDEDGFNRITRRLIEWGIEADLKDLREAYFATRVLDAEQYQAFVNMLHIFAEHLATVGHQLEIAAETQESPVMRRARVIIEEKQSDDITSRDVARMLNTSTFYFCKLFKKATGLTFTEYLTRVRVEKAKNFLLNPHLRVSEIAYQVGFRSLSQFNRSFRNLVGQTPSEYRETRGVSTGV